jgi:hypothetical protein
MSENPQVELDWKLWCSKHLEPFREEWPKGSALAMMGLFNAAVNDERIIELANHDTNKLTETLRAYSPVCCTLGDDVMNLVVGYAKEGKIFNGKDGPMEPKGGDARE